MEKGLLLTNSRFGIISDMEYKNEYQKIKVSKAAYLKLKEIAKQDKYRGRGLIGALDDIMLGDFTTCGSGNYYENRAKTKQK